MRHATSAQGPDCLIVTVEPDYVTSEPLNPIRRCTPLSVAITACTRTRARAPVEPGGLLDTSDFTFRFPTAP